jgi:hypothetical protein
MQSMIWVLNLCWLHYCCKSWIWLFLSKFQSHFNTHSHRNSSRCVIDDFCHQVSIYLQYIHTATQKSYSRTRHFSEFDYQTFFNEIQWSCSRWIGQILDGRWSFRIRPNKDQMGSTIPSEFCCCLWREGITGWDLCTINYSRLWLLWGRLMLYISLLYSFLVMCVRIHVSITILELA